MAEVSMTQGSPDQRPVFGAAPSATLKSAVGPHLQGGPPENNVARETGGYSPVMAMNADCDETSNFGHPSLR